jgi:type II secretory pathway pseudopilin PulG
MRKGFTLLETVFATSVFALVVIAAMGSWLMFMHKSNRAYTQASLDMDVRKVIERFRTEMRNAARETIIFYPENVSPAQAVGFALASDTDGDGLMDLDAAGSNILWRQTVVYHVFEQSPTQMRRTLFTGRNNGGLYADYYQQIAQVVSAGNGAGACMPGESASTTVMFENLFTGKLWHAESVYDGFAPKPNTLERVTFGSLPLAAGEHKITFTVKGKNPGSAGRNIRLDQLSASVSGWPLEAETRPYNGGAPSPAFVGEGLAGAAYGLSSGTVADGEAITFKVVNDAIEESEFIGKGRNVSLSNTVVRFDTTYQPAGFNAGSYVTKLEGRFEAAWSSSAQTGDGVRSEYYYPTNCAIRIPVIGQWVTQDGFGPVFRFYKSLKNAGLRLEHPMYAVIDTLGVITVPKPDVPDGELIPLVFYQDGVEKASWAACADMKYVELRPRQTERLYAKSTLIISFQVTATTFGDPDGDRFTVFDMKRSGIPGCWVIPGGDLTTVKNPIWSTDPQLEVLDKLPSLEGMAVCFADGGDYVSHPFDTKLSGGADKTVSWDADVPSGGTLVMYGRSGNTLSEDGFDILDAPEWVSAGLLANGGSMPGTGRYVQFRSVFQAQPVSVYPGLTGGVGSGPYRAATPRLRRVFVQWDGGAKYVDITANLLKGPDCGMFKVEVDGKPLVRGVTMEIEIFKDVITQGGVKKERLRSAMMAEVEPRNSAKK